jgi:hypothetical protein
MDGAVCSGSLCGLGSLSVLLRTCVVLKIILMLNRFHFHLILWNGLHISGIQRAQCLFVFIPATAGLRINDRINDTFGVIVELKITSLGADIFKMILSFLA